MSRVWRYTAIPLEGTTHPTAHQAGGSATAVTSVSANLVGGRRWFGSGQERKAQRSQTGELVAESAADARAALRRVGWQVVDLRPMRVSTGPERPASTHSRQRSVRSRQAAGDGLVGAAQVSIRGRLRSGVIAVRQVWQGHLRQRRRGRKAEFFDALATMLEAGLPLLEALETLSSASSAGDAVPVFARSSSLGVSMMRALVRPRQHLTPLRAMLTQLWADVQNGASLSVALSSHPSWFDAFDEAMMASASTRAICLPSCARWPRASSMPTRWAASSRRP